MSYMHFYRIKHGEQEYEGLRGQWGPNDQIVIDFFFNKKKFESLFGD